MWRSRRSDRWRGSNVWGGVNGRRCAVQRPDVTWLLGRRRPVRLLARILARWRTLKPLPAVGAVQRTGLARATAFRTERWLQVGSSLLSVQRTVVVDIKDRPPPGPARPRIHSQAAGASQESSRWHLPTGPRGSCTRWSSSRVRPDTSAMNRRQIDFEPFLWDRQPERRRDGPSYDQRSR